MANTARVMKEKFQEAIIGLKKYGYLVGILMVVMGVCMFLRPISTSTMFIWIIVCGVIANGISRLVMYFRLPKEYRNGWALALGILWLVAACMLMADAISLPIQTAISLQAMAGFFIAFNCIFSGVGSIASARLIKEMGGSAGLVVFSGIMEIVCGAIVMSSPLFGLFALTISFGIYLAIMGSCIIIRSIAY